MWLAWDSNVSRISGFQSNSGDHHNNQSASVHFAGLWVNQSEINEVSAGEALFRLYQQFGIVESARRVHGTASWIIWDEEKRQLHVVVDRWGQNPIYYYRYGSLFYFSTDLEALLKQSGGRPAYNREMVLCRLGRLPPPREATFYQNIYRLEKATCTTFSEGGEKNDANYWLPALGPALRLSDDIAYGEAYRDVLRDVTKSYLPDTEIAATVSGGMDSTSVAAALRLAAPERHITAISLVSPAYPTDDESDAISEVCTALNLESRTLDAGSLWPFCDEVLTTPSPTAPRSIMFLESWHAFAKIAQVLGASRLFMGLGGDYLIGDLSQSYADLVVQFKWFELARQLKKHLPISTYARPWLKIPYHQILKPLYQVYFSRNPAPLIIPGYLTKTAIKDFKEIHAKQKYPIRCAERKHLPARILRWEHIVNAKPEGYFEDLAPLRKQYNLDFIAPLFDHRMIEFALSLPSNQFFHTGTRKYIARNAFKNILPDQVINRRIKIIPEAIYRLGYHEKEQEKVFNLLNNMMLAREGLVDETILTERYKDYLQKPVFAKIYPIANALQVEIFLRQWQN